MLWCYLYVRLRHWKHVIRPINCLVLQVFWTWLNCQCTRGGDYTITCFALHKNTICTHGTIYKMSCMSYQELLSPRLPRWKEKDIPCCVAITCTHSEYGVIACRHVPYGHCPIAISFYINKYYDATSWHFKDITPMGIASLCKRKVLAGSTLHTARMQVTSQVVAMLAVNGNNHCLACHLGTPTLTEWDMRLPRNVVCHIVMQGRVWWCGLGLLREWSRAIDSQV